jgi:septum formation protein
VPTRLILASSSPYRKQLLERLRLDFDCIPADVDESILPGETAPRYVRRLAREKARVVAERHRDAVVIGSDQCALLDGEILGKPGTHENAMRQLGKAQGRRVTFHTAVCVMHIERAI